MKWSGRIPQPPTILGLPPMVDPPTLPSHIECPRCGARPGYGCQTATGFTAATHRDRWEAVGIRDKETKLALLHADWEFVRECRRKLIASSYA